jgi:hypothetical protein
MPKVVILIKKKPGMSREAFIEYYERSHVVLAKRLLGHLMVKYERNYPQALLNYHPEDYDIGESYDAVTEISLKSDAALEEMNRICNIPENAAAIIKDEEVFQDRLKTRILIVDSVDTGTELLDTDTTHRDIVPRALPN